MESNFNDCLLKCFTQFAEETSLSNQDWIIILIATLFPRTLECIVVHINIVFN